MRKWLMRIHMYAGLLFFGFLIVFALSALAFNHHPAFMDAKTSTMWKQPVSAAAQPQLDPASYAEEIAKELGVTGRILPPTLSKTGDLDFSVTGPGRQYNVHVSGNSARVNEDRQNWAATLVHLHGVRPNTDSTLLNAWGWYSAIGALVLLASAITGVWIWAIRPRERILGWTLLTCATSLSLAICFYIRLRG